MSDTTDCVFCDRNDLVWRIIRSDELFTSFVSRPWFREGHSVVIPNRHVTTIAELKPDEAAAIMQEIGRLSSRLDQGFGSGMMQKYQPLQTENGIKVNHLHFHVIPRIEHEMGLFPVPTPNSFDGFTTASENEIISVLNRLQ